MALSEDEQKMLNLIAERMYEDDPRLATSLATETYGTPNRKKAGLGILIFLVGMIVLVAAVATQIIFIGPVGFLVALGGAVMAYQAIPALRRRT